MTDNDSIHIVGAGLAGSLLACYFARRGLSVEVWERNSDMRAEDIPAGRSINLALANRGIRALNEVGLAEQVTPLLIPMRGRMLHNRNGELQLQPYGQREHEVIYSVSRADLNRIMMSAAEATGYVTIHFKRRLDAIDFATGRLSFDDDREQINIRRLIASDGAGSVVRRAMKQLPEFESTEDLLTHSYKELTMPPAPGGSFRIEKNALHIWPRGGHMLIALPNLDGSFTVTLFLPNEGEPGFSSLDTPETVEAFFEEQFADALLHLPDLTEQFFENPTGSLGTVRCWPWCVGGRSLLVGDAAHAIVPFHGQGMNAAFEDCFVLDGCLDSEDNWDAAFDAYQRRRKADADAIADMALENYIEMRDSVRHPRFHLQKQLAFELERRHPGVFVPRYSLVMFHHVPYSEAQRRGEIQKRILGTLTEGIDNLADVDLERADELVLSELTEIEELAENA
ncbi:MAG: NAD(P)/FAD-dependent oxidoreductase [Gammaproteobacteria bacterium]